MQELVYPFNSRYIISHEKKLRRKLLEDGSSRVRKNIAILGGSTTNDIKLVLELFLLNYGIEPCFYESEYNQYYQDAMFSNERLEAFKPDIIYIHTTIRNIIEWPAITDSAEEIEDLLLKETTKYRGLWARLSEVYRCPIIQNNFEMPSYRLLGNMDVSDIHGKANYVSRLNEKWYEYAQAHDDFYICDINYISADYGLKNWFNTSYWYMYKYAMDLYAIPSLSFNVSNIIKAIFGKNKKGFVLDLDNTLWGGVIGDDGVENIALGPEEAEGQAYLEFQSYIKEHTQLGVILNIASKNDYNNAIAGLEHPDAVLKKQDFISIKANWEPKDQNFNAIAEELSLMPESLVFVDDNPAEREIVTGRLQNISAPDLGKVQDYIERIDRSGFFECVGISRDDLRRNQMYKENAERSAQAVKYENYRDYLLSLEMKATIKPFEPMYYARIAQLSNKSNQFNLTTKRYTQDEIEAIAGNKEFITLYGKLEDKFGDNGVVSLLIGRLEKDVCHMDLWLMSCRVLKRDMEFAMMDSLIKTCKEKHIYEIRGYYYPTEKNSMVREFYKTQGFDKISEDEKGNTTWNFIVNEVYENKNTVIEVEA